MRFEWDERKRVRNVTQHGLDFAAAKRVFDDPCVLVRLDARRDYGEARYQAVGEVNHVVILVAYTWRRSTCRIISARRAHDKERNAYRRARERQTQL